MMTKAFIVAGVALAVAGVAGSYARHSRHEALLKIAGERKGRECSGLESRARSRDDTLRQLVLLQRWLSQFRGGALPIDVDAWCRLKVEKDLGFRQTLPGVGAPPADNLPLPDALVGTTRAEILSVLGDATCGDWNKAEKRFVATPCAESARLTYGFYYLPDGYRGGGPEMFLGFDRSGICTSARWLWSQ